MKNNGTKNLGELPVTLDRNQSLYRGEINDIKAIDIDKVVCDNQYQSFYEYERIFNIAANKANKENRDSESKLFSFISIICSFNASFWDFQNPYHPSMINGGRRSFMPEDLHHSDVEALKEIFKTIKNLIIKARIGDVVWIIQRNSNQRNEAFEIVKKAIDSYIEVSIKISNNELERGQNFSWWYNSQEFLQRAIQLCKQINKKTNPEYFNKAKEALVNLVKSEKATKDKNCQARLLEVCLHEDIGEYEDLARIAVNKANLLTKKRKKQTKDKESETNKSIEKIQPNDIIQYWKLAQKLYYKCNDNEKNIEIWKELQTSYEDLANYWINEFHNKPQYGSAASAKREALIAAQCCKADEKTVKRLLKEIESFNKKFIEEGLTRIKSPAFDIRPYILSSVKHVSGYSFHEALYRFAFGHKLLDLSELEKRVKKNNSESIWYGKMKKSYSDERGATTKNINPLSSFEIFGGQEINNESLKSYMYDEANMLDWGLRSQGYIEPCMMTITNEHNPLIHDFDSIVANNPFIPQGHEGVFLRGIHAGIYGDFMLFTHLIIPQIENSLRFILNQHGYVSTKNPQKESSGFTEDYKLLGDLLQKKENSDNLEKIFGFEGKEIIFELKGLLVEKNCGEFRNRLLHGFYADNMSYTTHAINLYWVILRMLLYPIKICKSE